MTVEKSSELVDFHPIVSSQDGEHGNRRGIEAEQKVALLIGSIPLVLRVKETGRGSKEDLDMIDLIVDLNAGDYDLVVPEVKVQVKASSNGIWHFYYQVRRKLSNGTSSSSETDVKDWMLRNRIVLINGGVDISRSRKTRRELTDQEIQIEFLSQVGQIDKYERNLRDRD